MITAWEVAVQALFVHGMGRSPISGWPLLWHLRRAGLKPRSFGYLVSLEDFAAIERRLAAKIARLASREDYVLIGHSLGGVLIRAAVNSLPDATRRPRHIFLLGSPHRASRLAQRLGRNPVYRLLTRDCGQLLGSTQRMAAVGAVGVPTTSIAGVAGPQRYFTAFPGEPNDGVVSLSEVSAHWIGDQVQVPLIHTVLPMSTSVALTILERLAFDRRSISADPG
ncbi:MAG: alpha/beta fold hydrolase [Burkholderiaceae bacterium]